MNKARGRSAITAASCLTVCMLLNILSACSLTPDSADSDARNAELSGLTISSGVLSPEFSAQTTAYSATVASSVAGITVIAVSAAASARIDARVNNGTWAEIVSGNPSALLTLKVGANTIEVQVTAKDGETIKTYSLSVYRLSAEALLGALSASPGTLDPAFSPETIGYALSVANSVSSLAVMATVAHPGATIQVRVNGGSWQAVDLGSPSQAVALVVGDNAVEVKVTAEDGVTSNTYSITAHRISADPNLAGLAPSSGTMNPAFDAATTSYAVTVPSEANDITLTATAACPLAAIQVRVNGGGWQAAATGAPSPSLPLGVGDNVVEVQVTAEDGATQKSYAIAVHRQSGNADLSSLLISAGTLKPAFSSPTASYTATVLNTDGSVTVTAVVADALAAGIQVQLNASGWQVVASGVSSAPLSLGLGTNTVEVKVAAEDTTVTRTYTILVVRRYPGALDIDFPTGSGTNDSVLCLALQADGKILLAGPFYVYDGIWIGNNVARLDPDGSWDSSWTTGSGANYWSTWSVASQNDGKVLIGGDFTTYHGTNRGHVARLNGNGSLDTSFLASGAGANGRVVAIMPLASGKILIGGHFNTYNGTSRGNIARLNGDGSLDESFLASGTGTNNRILSLALQTDNKILIGGIFTACNGTSRGNIARLNDDGSLDTSFLASGAGANASVNAIVLESDGKVLIGGDFTTYNGTIRGHIARLNADGSLDPSFLASGTGADNSVMAVSVQSNGKILIGGGFATYDSTARGGMARLNEDGSLEASFLSTGAGAYGDVRTIAPLTDGRILICGGFFIFNGIYRNHIARLWLE